MGFLTLLAPLHFAALEGTSTVSTITFWGSQCTDMVPGLVPEED